MSSQALATPIRLATLSLIGLIALPQAALATNGYFSHGYGVKAQAVAGVGIALPQDSLAAATNPAGTALVGSRLDAGLNLFSPNRGSEVTGDTSPLKGSYNGDARKHFLIPEFGYTRELGSDLSVGLAIFGNGGMNTSYDTNPFGGVGAQGKAGVNLEQLFISPSVAYKATPEHTLGAAVILAHQRFSARGIELFGNFSASPQNVSNLGTDSDNGLGIRLGWIGQLTPQWRVGATWASEIDGRFDKYKGLFAEQGGFDIPANYGLGVAFQPTQDWTLAADYQVIQYSKVKSVGNPLSKLDEGKLLGSADGPGFGWKDVKVIKLGVIHQWSDQLTLRGGYSHATQPVPEDQTFLNILAPGVVQNHITVGFGWKLDAKSELSGYYGHAFNEEVKGKGSIGVGFGGGEANVRLKENILGVAYGWKF